MKKESEIQADIIEDIYKRLPGCIVLKNDPNYIQGIPDLTILYKTGKWATLEVKRTLNSSHQPNQDYYVEVMDSMGFSSFICPENSKEVIEEMILYLKGFTGGRL